MKKLRVKSNYVDREMETVYGGRILLVMAFAPVATAKAKTKAKR